jgi:uncharacterized protein (DUF2062 family)
MMRRLRNLTWMLLRIEDTPHRTALAFGIGVFIAFFPIIGIHTALALLLAYAFRLSRVAILLGTFLNNPWTLGPILMGGTLLGCALLGVPPDAIAGMQWDSDLRSFYATLIGVLRPYLLPYLVGNITAGLGFGSISYALLRRVLERRAAAPQAVL